MDYERSKTLRTDASVGKRRHGKRRSTILLAASVLLALLVVGGTVAYLIATSAPVENTFNPAHVTCAVTEEFDGTVKKNVNVKNTSDIPAYIRVKLITYRVNDNEEHIGGTATITMPETLGDGWVKYPATGDDFYYYYTKPVAAGESPKKPLIGEPGITLKEYDDADGGKQVIEVLAEAIQATPPDAVQEAWGVTIAENNVSAYSGGGGEG